ncbi:hypothetical protein B0H14DRAFT_289194 [Mycena olivaceomarginata]|nr:hypothetical protein B0H14DRAFT_289194 [Mycena olivaceomarginata]
MSPKESPAPRPYATPSSPPMSNEDRTNNKPSSQLNPNSAAGEYDTGRVTCEVCGRGVSFRDDSGAFTLKYWEAHRTTCSPPQPLNAHIQPADTSASSAAGPSTFDPRLGVPHGSPSIKRRRAKRTEEERIDYLRSDPRVAKFEAYRVLCAGCNKWIKLRPNSTYCSIPWDAHRKSCVEKTM